MKKNLKTPISSAKGKIALLFLRIWIFGIAGYSCISMEDLGSPAVGNPFLGMPGAATAILPDIPQIAWGDLTQGQLIGRGGFGDVYEGQWKGQDVAIKKLHMHALPNETVKRDFDNEVRVMWNSQYPRILRLYGVCTEPGSCAMVMERMRRSLHDLIHSKEEVTDARRLQIAIDIAQGLASLHTQNILHRDLKSHNILLDRGDRGKISDFGLAKIRVHTKSTTRMGHVTGTLRWSAPEVLGFTPRTTSASDMYSYGMVLWELLTRKTPFENQPDDTVVLALVRSGKREYIPAGCHPVWQEVIQGCWKQEPGKRPTADAVLARFMSLKPPQRARWLPEEDPQVPLRAEGYVRQHASQGDWELVLRSYAPHPVPGYDVGRVEVIFNPSMNKEFKARCNRLQQRQGNPRYAASWRRQGPDGKARTEVARYLEVLTEPYQDEDYPSVKLMPLWHGTQRDKLGSLLKTGYSAFGDTDSGYFGKGIYAAFEAAYAQMYADNFGQTDLTNGVLIFNWGITYNSRPIIKSDFNHNLRQLNWVPDTATYDSHFVPVVRLTRVHYIPISPPETPQFTEVVFFDTSQILPRYLVTLQPTLPNSPLIPMCQMSALHEALKERRKGAGLADQKILTLEKKVEEMGLAQQNIAVAYQTIEDQKKQLEISQREVEMLRRTCNAAEAEQQRTQREKAIIHQNIEDMRKQLEASQREVDELRRKTREVEIAQRAAAGAERQRIQREQEAAERQRLRQEAEQQQKEEQQKQIREKVALWGSSIDTTMQRIRDLQNYQLTFGELVKVLDAMEKFYSNEKDMDVRYRVWRDEELRRLVAQYTYGAYRRECGHSPEVYGVKVHAAASPVYYQAAINLLKRDVAEKMEKYEQLSGNPHPRKDEFGRM